MSKKKTRIKIEAWNMAGKYNLPYNYGQVVEVEDKQAKEIIKNKDAREFSKETEKKEAEEAAAEGQSDRLSELKKLKRDQLNEIATGLGLKHEDYSTIDDIIPAIVEAEEKSE